MNGLVASGFILLGGPLVDTPDVLLIVRAADAQQVEERLAADCWAAKDLLRIKQISPWSLRLRPPGDP